MLVNLLSKVLEAAYSEKGQTAIKVVKTTAEAVVVVTLSAAAYLDENYSHSNEAAPF